MWFAKEQPKRVQSYSNDCQCLTQVTKINTASLLKALVKYSTNTTQAWCVNISAG